jgi:serine/threonine-protein kinase
MVADLTRSDPLESQLRNACEQLRARLLAGEECRVEDYFAGHPEWQAVHAHALPLIHAEYAARGERGNPPPLNELIARFPRFEEHLHALVLMMNEESHFVLATTALEAADLHSATAADFPIQSLDHHELREQLGDGGMGIVHKAYDPILKRPVALKFMKHGSLAGKEEVAQFYREARAAAGLRHPNIVPIYAMGMYCGQHCFTMALLPGGSLQSCREKFHDPRAAAALVEKIARAVQFAHEAGIIHRDLKPANILLDDNDEPHVADFGLAKLLEQDLGRSYAGRGAGTPPYMAPEQFPDGNGKVTVQADVWALGIILYELLAGKRPFDGGTWQEVSARVRTTEPPPLQSQRPGLDPSLEAVVMACLRRPVRERYPTAKELADDLARWSAGLQVSVRVVSRVKRLYHRFSRPLAVSRFTLILVLASLGVLSVLTGAGMPPAVEFHPVVWQLIDNQGQLTRPAEWIIGGDPTTIRSSETSLEIQHRELAAFLLAEPPWPNYLLEAEVRLDDPRTGTGAGLLLGHNRWPGPPESSHAFLTFSLEEGLWKESHVDLTVCLGPRCPQSTYNSRLAIKRQRVHFAEDAAQHDRWLKLKVEKTERGFRALWELPGGVAQSLPVISEKQFGDYTVGVFGVGWEEARRVEPGRRLGLFVKQGKASIRNLVLQSRPSP